MLNEHDAKANRRVRSIGCKLILPVSQSVVDHLSNDLDTLRDSRLLKLYADQYCNQERPMQFG